MMVMLTFCLTINSASDKVDLPTLLRSTAIGSQRRSPRAQGAPLSRVQPCAARSCRLGEKGLASIATRFWRARARAGDARLIAPSWAGGWTFRHHNTNRADDQPEAQHALANGQGGR
jgi:hypothetical protein